MKTAIERLIERVQGVRDERDQDKERAERASERDGELLFAKDRLLTDFWCDTCKVDLHRYGRKVVVALEPPVGLYKAFCGAWQCIAVFRRKHCINGQKKTTEFLTR